MSRRSYRQEQEHHLTEDRAAPVDPAVAVEVVEVILCQHWKPVGEGTCRCWVCRRARQGGLHARDRRMSLARRLPFVHVDPQITGTPAAHRWVY